jgi:3-oxoacyl-[acyl-carrier-protein] synthase-3
MVAESIKMLKPYEGFSVDDIELLVCGTSSADQILPGHALMVHGDLANKRAIEAVSTAGICLSGLTALKYVAMSVVSGASANGVATGSESASSYMKAGMFSGKKTASVSEETAEQQPYFSFEADFLRWMLSDGAAACFVANKPDPKKLNLRIDWIDVLSQAHRKEACMYSGAIKNEDGQLQGFRAFDSITDAVIAGAFPIKQDAKLLNSDIIEVIIDDTLLPLAKKHNLKPESVSWFLPHYSSEYFRQKVYDRMVKIGFEIGFDRWYSNLTTKGNTGSASIFIMIEELLKSGKLKQGDTLLCMVPESGRFSCGYMHLTVC